jgi:alpha-beta hydrolase superfamily lysophospholipase
VKVRTRSVAWRALAAVAACVGACLLEALVARAASEQGQRLVACAGPGDVAFRAPDGVRLVGHRFGRGTTAVVMAHEYRGDLCDWAPYARSLAARGYLAFAFDFRGNGSSQAVGYARANRLAGDVSGAVEYVRARGAENVFLLGASMGGTAVLAAGANTRPRVDGVISVSGPAEFGGADASTAVARLEAPVLYLVAANDDGFTDDAHALYRKTASSDKAIRVLPGAEHGVLLVGSSARARRFVEAFLASH